MITSKFGIGQCVQHKLLGFFGVVVDVDPEYSLSKLDINGIADYEKLRTAPWYHVIMEDDKGQTLHTYLSEAHLSWVMPSEPLEHSPLDALATSIRQQIQAPNLRH